MSRSLMDVLNEPRIGRAVAVTATVTDSSALDEFVEERDGVKVITNIARNTFELAMFEEHVEDFEDLDSVTALSIDGGIRFEGN